MYYQKIIPIKPLQEYIRYFWVLEDFTDNTTCKTFKIIPDGLPSLIFQNEPNLFFGNDGKAMPQLFLYGQSTRYTEHRVTGEFKVMGVYLQPTALKALFNIDAFELNNQNVSLEYIINEPILEKLVNAEFLNEKIDIISRLFLNLIQKIKYNDSKAEFASMQLQDGKTLKEIQIAMNISERSLERIIKQYVGMSPKTFSRIVRFQSSLNALRKTDFKNFTELAYIADYFDQSHYIKEFKEFTGTNPKHYLLNTNEHLANFPLWKE
ncbi:helix-turn-helix domain-containing protein [Sphingobacterium sp. SGR-19]|uniref:helix-turn-helix domain-containing protein n=1 Tax=Sphingobacterium sp. SGR-19 TaxID=2710886 RepID=UPI0013EB25B1|nr:helix-turn-helix domain-containing protein [Sphingobacterium sp. SGR-19]NGM65093.1 AraC family transcriptional regulator [Sphingobacterium sp. SGR-19]